MKHRYILFITSLIICLFFSSAVVAQEEEDFIDPDIPDSWYEAPKTASEMNINEFNQSPALDEAVEEGELPPVEERLPDDPPVIEPYDEIGEYGGTAEVWGLRDNPQDYNLFNYQRAFGRATPEAREIVPLILEDWEFSDDKKTWTINLHKGMKWSDGEPLTADDFIYWWEHHAKNEELSPVPPEKSDPPLLEVEKVDDYTVAYHFDRPVPLLTNLIHIRTGVTWYGPAPAHFYKQFHPDFVGKEELEEIVSETGFDTWYEYYESLSANYEADPEEDEIPPVYNLPYIPSERTSTHVIMERNPYYPFVDTEGNQLPYIDKFKINFAEDPETVKIQATEGNASMASFQIKAEDIPIFREYEDKGNYEVRLFEKDWATDPHINVNLSHENEEMREIFQDLRFRKAISHAIDREEINERLYFDLARPIQVTAHKSSKYYKPEYADAYIEYDPEKSKELLNEMGLKDVDEDGYRERLDGENFNPHVLTISKYVSTLELVQSHLEDVGINIDIEAVSDSLHFDRLQANEYDIHAFDCSRYTDMFNEVLPRLWAPVSDSWTWSPWVSWMNWYNTDGESGMKPPQKLNGTNLRELTEMAEELVITIDPEEREQKMEKLVEAQAENLWRIGTVGELPHPFIVSNNLKNVPQEGIKFQSDLMGYTAYYTEQFYFEQ